MKKLLLVIPFILFAFSSKYTPHLNNVFKNIHCDEVLHKKAFDICYSCTLKHPLSVAYILKGSLVNKNNYSREDLKFRPDYNLPRKCRSYPGDYTHSGYDRGHNAPNAVFDYNRTIQKQTFLMSNISPQAKWLNRKYWAKVERYARYLAVKTGKVEVITGSCGSKSEKLGWHKVDVPAYWYKIIYVPKWNLTRVFLVPNTNVDMKTAKLKKYLTNLKNFKEICNKQ